jgi:hypothetical protein
MHHHRQALQRIRLGDSDRDIAAAKILGRRHAGDLRRVAMDRARRQRRAHAETFALAA